MAAHHRDGVALDVAADERVAVRLLRSERCNGDRTMSMTDRNDAVVLAVGIERLVAVAG